MNYTGLNKYELSEFRDLFAKLEAAALAYEDAQQKMVGFCAGIAQQADDMFSSRSEKWQESDAGQNLQGFGQTWQDAVDLLQQAETVDLTAEVDGLPLTVGD